MVREAVLAFSHTQLQIARICNGVLTVSIVLLALSAQASDWRFAGSAKGSNNAELVLFFDAATVSHASKDSVRFWVKGIQEGQFDRYLKAHKRSLIDQTAAKVATGYAPDLFLLPEIRAQFKTDSELRDRILDATSWEIIANDMSVPKARELYFEIDCAGKRSKTLDVKVYDEHGELRPIPGRPTQEYTFIAPDSNIQRWSLLLCAPK